MWDYVMNFAERIFGQYNYYSDHNKLHEFEGSLHTLMSKTKLKT